jgi:hypothetical protein
MGWRARTPVIKERPDAKASAPCAPESGRDAQIQLFQVALGCVRASEGGFDMTAGKSVFLITQRRRIWRVTLNDVFFGDYRSKRNAVESVEEASRKLSAAGKISTILVAAGET